MFDINQCGAVIAAFARMTKMGVDKVKDLLMGCSYEVVTLLVKLARAIGPSQRADDDQVIAAWKVTRNVLLGICDCGLNAGRILTNVGWVPVANYRVPQCLVEALPAPYLVASSWLAESNMRRGCSIRSEKATNSGEFEAALAVLCGAARNRQFMDTLTGVPEGYGEKRQTLNLDVITVVTDDGKFYGCGMNPEKIIQAIPINSGIEKYARRVGTVDDYEAYLLTLLS